MKLTVHRADLDQALRAIKGTSARSTIPILECCKISSVGGKVSIMSTNMDMWSTFEIGDAEVDDDGEFCLSLSSFASFVSRLPNEDVVIDDSGLVKCKRSKATIQPLPGKDFPAPTIEALSDPFVIASDEAERLLGSTIIAVGNEEFRAYLCGVHLRSVDGFLVADAADGKIAISMQSSIEADIEPVILPTLAVRSALSVMGSDGLSIALSPNMSMLTSGPFSLLTRNIDGPFPEIERIKAPDPSISITVDRDEFIAATQRVHGLTEESKDAVNKIRGRLVSLEPKKDALIIRSANGHTTSAVDEIDADVSGDPTDIGFLAENLIKLTSIVPEGKMIIGATDARTQVSFGYEDMRGWSVAMPALV